MRIPETVAGLPGGGRRLASGPPARSARAGPTGCQHVAGAVRPRSRAFRNTSSAPTGRQRRGETGPEFRGLTAPAKRSRPVGPDCFPFVLFRRSVILHRRCRAFPFCGPGRTPVHWQPSPPIQIERSAHADRETGRTLLLWRGAGRAVASRRLFDAPPQSWSPRIGLILDCRSSPEIAARIVGCV